MFVMPSLISRPRSCTRWLKVKMIQWQSFVKCCTRASSDNFMYVKVTWKGGETPFGECAILGYSLDFGFNLLMCCVLALLWLGFLFFFQSPEGISPAHQQVALLDLQSALFCSQLEIQKLQRVVRQKERQLADAKRCVQFVEAAAHDREQQKEASWKHNQVNH